ncbi:MAG: hypothetical protein M3444_07175 [Acidobacteriota bacterium]|nr:hypothetical protein [Acidobacteriota bacterium]MDQ5836422.1 hypothetical protein [Acidobacteriota bacterium]
MRKPGPASIFVFIFACASLGLCAQARAQTRAVPASAKAVGEGRARMSEAEERLARDSRAAIVAQGISAPYFDAHFKLFKVSDAQGDRRVVWRFEVNSHTAFVNDTVGYYTDARGRLVDTHSVASALPAAHDITRTISRTRAERIMRACIGRFEGGAVVYRAAGLPERASLIFTASSAPRRTRRESSAEREREEREASAKKGKPPRQTDVIEEGDDEGGEPVYLGAVDLETGRCTRGLGVADHPAPERRPREQQ